MKKSLKRIGYPAWNFAATINREPFKFIFILATARSGSTLLQHILTTNPEISGYGETKSHLETTADLPYLAGKILYYKWRHKVHRHKHDVYLLDKIVHNEYLKLEHAALLNDSRIAPIFLIREPASSLNSFMKALDVDAQHALFYYQSRLQMLTRYAEVMNSSRKAFFLDYAQLIDSSMAVLHALQQFLGLSEPLSEKYKVRSITGNFGIGDNSENIQKGEIQRAPADHFPDLPEGIIDQAADAYETATSKLSASCTLVAGEQLLI